MPQVLGPDGLPHKMCPVRSYENYVNSLNQKLNSLWQTAMKNFSTDPANPVNYKCVPLRHNTLDKFLSCLSKKCNLTDYYTNHCICVTGITTFKRGQCTDSQIMAVSSHKSIQSLALYQCVADDEKFLMGMKLTYSLLKPQEALLLKENNPIAAGQQIQKTTPPTTTAKAIEAPPPAEKSSEKLPVSTYPQDVPELHALNPANKNILPLDNALVPYAKPQNENATIPQTFNFDILDLLSDIENDDQQLVMAATQIEEQYQA